MTASKSTAASKPTSGRSLMDFVRDERRKGCRVCALPSEVKTQLATASDRKIKRDDVLGWLKAELKVTITNAELDTHKSGRHDRG